MFWGVYHFNSEAKTPQFVMDEELNLPGFLARGLQLNENDFATGEQTEPVREASIVNCGEFQTPATNSLYLSDESFLNRVFARSIFAFHKWGNF